MWRICKWFEESLGKGVSNCGLQSDETPVVQRRGLVSGAMVCCTLQCLCRFSVQNTCVDSILHVCSVQSANIGLI